MSHLRSLENSGQGGMKSTNRAALPGDKLTRIEKLLLQDRTELKTVGTI